MAKLYFRYGAMNCGKTTNLIQVAFNYEERGMKVLLMKPKIDTKDGEYILSRLGIRRKVDILLEKKDNPFQIISDLSRKPDCILIDEAQFLTKEQIDDLLKIAVNLNVPVICYGLRTDFLMNGFEGAERLLLLSHSIEELKTICRCGRKATFNLRKMNGKPVFEGEQIQIDDSASVSYESVCGRCFFDLKSFIF